MERSRKIFNSCVESLKGLIQDGMSISIGGFGICGIPDGLISALADCHAKNLVIVSANCGSPGFGVDRLAAVNSIRKLITAYVGGSPFCEKAVLNKSFEIEFIPQGLLSAMLATGSFGSPGFYTRSGIDTDFAIGKERKIINNKEFFLVESIKTDLALIRAHVSDGFGNCCFRKSARNFNPVMAQSASIVVLEIDRFDNNLDPDLFHLPGVFVDRIVETPLVPETRGIKEAEKVK